MRKVGSSFVFILLFAFLGCGGTGSSPSGNTPLQPASRSLSLTGWTQVDGYGDSRTSCCDPSTPSKRYLNQLASLVGVSSPNNYAWSGTYVADAAVQAFNDGSPVASNLQVWAPGINDVWSGPGPYEATFNSLWLAGVSWLAIPASAKYTGASFKTLPTNWTADNSYAKVTGIQTSTQGATAVFPYSTTSQKQQPILWYGCVNGDNGTFTVADSAGEPAFSLTVSPAAAIWKLGPTSQNNNAGNASICSQPLEISNRAPGSYKATVTVTSSTGVVYIYGLGVPPSTTDGAPFVLAYVPYRNRNSEIESLRLVYKNDILKDCTWLNNSGFNVGCVDPDNFVLGTTTGSYPEFWDGTGTAPYGCAAGIPDPGAWVHGCDAVQDELVLAAKAPFL
jgi:hypothetical protein